MPSVSMTTMKSTCGGLARLLGQGLQDCGRILRPERVLEAEGVGEGLRDGDRPVAGFPVDVVAGLEHERQQCGGSEQHHDRHLEDEYLSGDAPEPVA